MCAKDLIKWWHIFGEWAPRGRPRLGLDEGGPARRASPAETSGKDPVTELADTVSNSLEPVERKVTIKEPTDADQWPFIALKELQPLLEIRL